jgi:hypothetical protein
VTPDKVMLALAVMVAVPMEPVAETPVRVVLFSATTVAVPIEPVAETPVRLTDTSTVPRLANGATAKEVKPNMCNPPFY